MKRPRVFPLRSLCRFAPLLALGLVAAGAPEPASGCAQAREEPASRAAAAAAPAAKPEGLPVGVAPLEGAAAERFRGLVEKAEKVRGLQALRPVAAGTLDEAALRVRMTEALREDLPPEKIGAMELGLKAFGLIPEPMSLARYLPELMTSQVAGYYDPERKYLALVRRPATAAGKAKRGVAGFDEDDMVVLHEIVHSLQDQHFDLLRLWKSADPTADESTAHAALVEGDASLAMLLGGPGFELSMLDEVGPALEKALDDPAYLESAELPGGAAMKEAPPFLRDSLLFSYLKGILFAIRVRQAGGQKLLDHAFATDPPSSSEQILHPEKWFGDRDDPVDLKLPDLAAALPRFRERSGGEMGEIGVRLLLREMGGGGSESADRAAAGWGGDRFEVYARGAERRLVWLLDWDTEPDADEFVAAAQGLGRAWKVERLAPRRVAVLRGDWGGEEREDLKRRLAAVEARAPRNVRIDLAAIGAEPEKKGAARIVSPEAERPAKTGAVSADGRTYRDEEFGFSIGLPQGHPDWAFETDMGQEQILVGIVEPAHGGAVLAMKGPPEAAGGAEGMAKAFESGFRARLPDYERLSGGPMTLGGHPAYGLEFAGNTAEGLHLWGQVLMVPLESASLVFSATIPGPDGKGMQAPVGKIFDSIEIFPARDGGRP